jgi:hypothetical protein
MDIEECDICERKCDGVHSNKIISKEKEIQKITNMLESYGEKMVDEIIKQIYENRHTDENKMKKNKEDENEKKYFVGSKQQIDKFIYNNDFKKAFWLLILFLERVNDNQKQELINYYSENLINFNFGIKIA